MFETMMKRAEAKARLKARLKARALAENAAAVLPRGIEAQAGADGVRLSGPGLGRRLADDSGLRWLIAGLVK